MYCRNCRYDLRGLPEPRCPECGTAFDPGDPHTFLATLDRPGQAIRRSMVMCFGPFVVIGSLVVVEVVYANIARHSAGSPSLPLFHQWALLAELLLLLFALLNVLLAHRHLSCFNGYRRAGVAFKVVLAVGAGAAYLAAVGGALVFVAMLHMW